MYVLCVSLLAIAVGLPFFASIAQATEKLIASVQGRVISVNGEPLFPIIAWRQCAADVEENLAIGVNVFMGTSCNQENLVHAVAGRAYVVPDYAFSGQEFPGLIGYHLMDEPDGNDILPEELPKTERVDETGRLIFLTIKASFADKQAPILSVMGKDVYARYADNVDVLGFDLYPLAHSCGNPSLGIQPVYDDQRDLVRLVGEKPAFQWIEVNALEGSCGADPVSSATVRAEAWLAIAGGATGLGYFTHGWPEGKWKRFHLSREVAAMIAATNREIQAFSPVLLAEPLAIGSPSRDPVKVGSRRYKGTIYLFAVNASRESVLWRRKLPDIAKRRQVTVSVYGEERNITVRNGRIADRFEPYAVRIYTYS